MSLLDPERRYRVEGHGGVAFYFVRDDTKPDEDSEWSGYEPPTGMVVMCMVGDDVEWTAHPDECSVLSPDEYCPECGQIGCKALG